MSGIKYEILKTIGILSENSRGWTKELNLISWNGGKPKYDIRDWAPGHEKMGKGVTLTEEELRALAALIQEVPDVPVEQKEAAEKDSGDKKEDSPAKVVSMKALSIHPGFAMCIVTGQKTVECRSRTTGYRGDILICSTAKKEKGTIPGHALGVVTLEDVVPFQKTFKGCDDEQLL